MRLLWQHGSNRHPYGEEVFHELLAIERERAERLHRDAIVVLASLRPTAATTRPLSTMLAARLFSGLAGCVREIDFIGWYRRGHIVGAVLAQSAAQAPEVPARVKDRVRDALCLTLPSHVHAELQLQVVDLRRLPRS